MPTLRVAKPELDVLYLISFLAGPQLAAVLERKAAMLLIHDEEFEALLDPFAGPSRPPARRDRSAATQQPSLELLIHSAPDVDLRAPVRY